ncbi:flavin reductase [Limnochorda pilosa]|uniref:Flavin reductase n=1 Tax=Limnochorda pilosa TaxID=1555112 RepID=A0A0K2SIR6_LIMPI|nr:flavin reductase [Limnochorda pilosa]BAS26714.1 flavin reductase [Limnochorda pilosa]
MTSEKVPLVLDKDAWHPSVLPGQIVLVSTVDSDGEPNVAPKSWITMAAFAGPILAFGCNKEHTTYRNVLATGEFVVNIPGEPLADRAWEMARHHGLQRLEKSGLTLKPAAKVAAPMVEECRAHLECVLDSVKEFGDEVLIFGRIVAGSIDASCLEGGPPEQYFALRPIFFLEEGYYGSLDTAKRAGAPWPTEQAHFVVAIGRHDDVVRETVEHHVEYLQTLRRRGSLWMAGPSSTQETAAANLRLGDLSGMYVLRASSLKAAEAVVQQDPLVAAGAPVSVRAWTRTF